MGDFSFSFFSLTGLLLKCVNNLCPRESKLQTCGDDDVLVSILLLMIFLSLSQHCKS